MMLVRHSPLQYYELLLIVSWQKRILQKQLNGSHSIWQVSKETITFLLLYRTTGIHLNQWEQHWCQSSSMMLIFSLRLIIGSNYLHITPGTSVSCLMCYIKCVNSNNIIIRQCFVSVEISIIVCTVLMVKTIVRSCTITWPWYCKCRNNSYRCRNCSYMCKNNSYTCRNYSCTAKRWLTPCAMCRNFSYKVQQCGNISYKILQKFLIKLYTCRNHSSYTSIKFFPALYLKIMNSYLVWNVVSSPFCYNLIVTASNGSLL